MKNTFGLMIAVFLFLNIFSDGMADEKSKDAAEDKIVKVIYFHGDKRCPTCLKIEKFTGESVKKNYAGELEKGKVQWFSINFDKEENEHLIDTYNLYTQTLVVVKYENGKRKEWKVLQKVWELTGDEKKFADYVKKEVAEYLKDK